MRMKGRRLALLLAGALPLLADEHDIVIEVGEQSAHAGQTEESLRLQPQVAIVDDDENDHHGHDVAEALHDDGLRKLPALSEASLLLDEAEDVKAKPQDGQIAKDTEPSKDDSSITEDEAISDPINDSSTVGDDKVKDPDPLENQEKVTPDDPSTQPSLEDSEASRVNESAGKSKNADHNFKGEDSSVPVDNEESTTSTDSNASETIIEEKDDDDSTSDDNATAQDESTTGHPDTASTHDDTSSSTTTSDEDTNTKSSEEEEDVLTERLTVDYASKSAGALILEKSPSMKGTSNLLNSDRDKYAIAPCEEKKVVVISLSEDILVEKVKLANYERYSSRVEDFQILGSQDMANWEDFGNYKAHSGNGEQTFQLTEPSWARYLKFRFISHYGDEYYCTVSQIKVHGKTNLQDFTERKQREDSEQALLEELVDDGDVENVHVVATDTSETSQDDDAVGKDTQSGSNAAKAQEAPSVSMGEASTSNSGDTEKKSNEAEPSQDGKPIEDSDNADATLKSEGSLETEEKESVPVKSSSKEDSDKSMRSVSNTSSTSSEGSTDNSDNDKEDSEECTTNEDEEETATIDNVPTPQKKGSFCMQGETFDSNLPDALMNFQWESVLETSNALSTASIDRSASGRATEPRMPAPETLDIHAIRHKDDTAGFNDVIKDAVHEVLAQASDYTISDAINDLKQKMRTTIETTIGKVDYSSSSGSTRKTMETSIPAQADGQEQDSSGQVEAASSEVGLASSTSATQETKKDTQVSAQADKSENLQSNPESATTTNETPETNHHALADDGNAGLARVLKRFPSAECLETLNYTEFKAKIISKAKAKPGSSAPAGGGHVSGGRNEPIFKTLTDEIRTLQINQSVNDQFTKSLVSCYQRVLLDMSAEMESLQANQDKRLSEVEAMIQEMKAQSMTNQVKEIFAWFLSIVSVGAIKLFVSVLSVMDDPKVHAAVADAMERIKRVNLKQEGLSVLNWVKKVNREDLTDLVEIGETEQLKFAGVVLVILFIIRLALRVKKSAQTSNMPQLVKCKESVTKMDPPEEIKDIQEAQQVETMKSEAKVGQGNDCDRSINDPFDLEATMNRDSPDGDLPNPNLVPAVVTVETMKSTDNGNVVEDNRDESINDSVDSTASTNSDSVHQIQT
eukprot:CAMPEP_0195307022 /NCGR_PEP_ID=MMETSP0707-20130614/37502_1 /TAXON_ID=33640 /ORGANISM="Asterionellopsis glacialis, Strain CCMP134" /LENGTH=1143 /DNA_ID=CAMNT_0040371259 /DNA_START=69 /DNA_END=3500 /DNA_ORIENTATION=-